MAALTYIAQVDIGERGVDVSYKIIPAERGDREYPGAPAQIEISTAQWSDAGYWTSDEFDQYETLLIESCEQHATRETEEMTR